MKLKLTTCTVDLRTGDLGEGREGRLTSRELLLLERLARDAGEIVDRASLFEAFGYAPTARSRAVDKTMANLRAKLEEDPAHPVHLVTAYGQGYGLLPLEGPSAPAAGSSRLRRAPPDRFVGRGRERGQLLDALATPGLVTLTGPGGVGKTRLACELLDTRTEPGRFVELAAARTRQDLIVAMAAAMDLAEPSSAGLEEVGRALADRPGQLVVLDNLEHLTAFADVVATWVGHAPDASILATSRQPLKLRGERVVRLDPLEIDDAAELLRARAAEAGHPVQDCTLDDLLGLLDGMPLALELAAARLDLFTPDELASRLAQGRTQLRDERRDVPARFHDLDGLFEWSWTALSEDERALLGDLGVFESPFSIAAAEAVSGLPEEVSTEALGELVSRSLVQRRRIQGAVTFGLLGILRSFVRARHPDDARAAAERRHAEYHASNARRSLDAGPDLKVALERTIAWADGELAVRLLEQARTSLSRYAPLAEVGALAERVSTIAGLSEDLLDRTRIVHATVAARDNETMRAELEDVLGRARTRGDAVSALRAQRYLGILDQKAGAIGSALERLREALGLARQSGLRADEGALLEDIGLTLEGQGDAADLLEQALAIHREIGDRQSACVTLSNIGYALYRRGEVDASQESLVEALAIARELGQRRTEAALLGNLGVLHMDQGRFEQASAYFETSLELHREVGNREGEALYLMNLGLCFILRGHAEPAIANLRTACDLFGRIGHRRREGDALGNLGLVLLDTGELTEAEALLRRALELARETENRSREATVLRGLAQLSILDGEVGAARQQIEAALAIDRAMSRPRAEAIDRYDLARLEVDHGDAARARSLLAQSTPVHREVGNVRHEALSRGLEAVIHAREGRCDEARRAIAAAEALVADLAEPSTLAEVRLQRAEVEAHLGNPQRARHALTEAEQTPGARYLVRRHIERVRGALGLESA